MDWTTKFQSLSADVTASFGVDPYDDVIGDEYDDVIGAPGLEVTTSPTPKGPFHLRPLQGPGPALRGAHVRWGGARRRDGVLTR